MRGEKKKANKKKLGKERKKKNPKQEEKKNSRTKEIFTKRLSYFCKTVRKDKTREGPPKSIR